MVHRSLDSDWSGEFFYKRAALVFALLSTRLFGTTGTRVTVLVFRRGMFCIFLEGVSGVRALSRSEVNLHHLFVIKLKSSAGLVEAS